MKGEKKMKGFLDYQAGNSVFHRLNPLTKVLLSVLMCVVCFVSNSIFAALGIIALHIIIALVSGVGKTCLGLLKGLIKLSVILFVIQVLFVRSGNTLFTIPLINLAITDEGVMFSLLLVLRLAAVALPLSIMLCVTKMSDLTNSLVSTLHIPYKYAFSVITAIRFIPVFSSEMTAIMEAQTARGVQFDTKNIFKKIGLIVPMCVPLLISSVKKIDSSALSAELRGFNLRTPKSGYKTYRFHLKDLAAVCAGAIMLTVGIIL